MVNVWHTFVGDLKCLLQELDMQNRTWTRKEMDLAESIATRMEQCGLYDYSGAIKVIISHGLEIKHF